MSNFVHHGQIMQFLTHATIISPLTLVRRERLLPGTGEVVAKIGQAVSAVQVVARAPLKTEFQVVPACDLLQIAPEELAENLLVPVGTRVEQGTPLVRRSRFGRKTFISPVDGQLHEVVNGRLVFRREADFIELRALAQSRVVNRIANRGVILEINGSYIQAIWDSGKEGYGIIHVAVNAADSSFAGEQVAAEMSSPVLIVGKITRADVLEMAERAGAAGIITGSITADLLAAATAVNYPIFVTDGIGEQGMAAPTFQLFQDSEARKIALFSAPPNQSGQRPEIVIPLEAAAGEASPKAGQPLAAGQKVRILRAPFNNQVGTVEHIYPRTRATPLGARVYGARIKLPDGQTVFAPIANLDAMI